MDGLEASDRSCWLAEFATRMPAVPSRLAGKILRFGVQRFQMISRSERFPLSRDSAGDDCIVRAQTPILMLHDYGGMTASSTSEISNEIPKRTGKAIIAVSGSRKPNFSLTHY